MNRALRLIYFSAALLMGIGIIFLCGKVEMYSNYNLELHGQLAQSAKAYDEAIKKVWRLEVELDYYKSSFERLERVYKQLLLNPIEVEVPVEKEVEVIREVPVELQWFESIEELKTWLGQIDLIRLKPDPEGIIQLRGICEDVAMFLLDEAEKDGYKVSFEILGESKYLKWYGKRLNEGQLHAINSAIIGNEVWFIDLGGDKVWVGAYLD